MSRRRGWEAAYCDYESLKLLLTHIEAVYEEHENENHNDSDGYGSIDRFLGGGFGVEDAFMMDVDDERLHSHFGGHGGHGDHEHEHEQLSLLNRVSSRRRTRTRQSQSQSKSQSQSQSQSSLRKKKQQLNSSKDQMKRDWRDELFAESDSSAAFASSEYESDPEECDDRSPQSFGGDAPHGVSVNRHHGRGSRHDLDNANFNFSYDNAYSSGSFGMGGNDHSNSAASASAASASGLLSLESSKGSGGSLEHMNTSNANVNVNVSNTGNSNTGYLDFSDGSKQSNKGENTGSALASGHARQQRGGVQGFGSGLGTSIHSHRRPPPPTHHTNQTHAHGTHGINTIAPHALQQRTRTRTRTRKRRHRRSNVPPHLRKAHEKARAITGRFLGLMRAEVDKISLFTHSRMGELTDTIGSLRFPSDDCMDYGANLDHPLSDGGLHPSASSSSEDISISSDGENDNGRSHGRGRGRGSHARSDNYILDPPMFQVQGERNRRRNQHSRRRDGRYGNESEWMDDGGQGIDDDVVKSTAFRQLRLAEELRVSRPIFQRSDQVLGEDFLLLSAVDEADAFTAVGVEFIHLLRYIFVNAIAIRKLCKKHDSLLSSRMLGGYYHRLQKQTDTLDDTANYDVRVPDLNGTPKRKNTALRRHRKKSRPIEFLPLPTHSSILKSPRGKYKLVGVHDSRVQKLANSLIASTLSDSLCLALSEFEVSRRRADRLSSFHRDMQKSRAVSYESLNDLVSLGADDDLYHCFPSPKTFGFTSKQPQQNFKESGELSGDEKSDAPSTSSNISLSRLRFVVTSVITLRDAGVETQNLFSEYLSRSSVTVDGRGCFVGEPFGLNGCSRETLDFFVSYNPDYALTLDCHILQEALSNQDHVLSLSYLLQDPCNLKNDTTPISSPNRENSVHSTTESIVSSSVSSPNYVKGMTTESQQRMFQLNIVSVILSTVSYFNLRAVCCKFFESHFVPNSKLTNLLPLTDELLQYLAICCKFLLQSWMEICPFCIIDWKHKCDSSVIPLLPCLSCLHSERVFIQEDARYFILVPSCWKYIVCQGL